MTQIGDALAHEWATIRHHLHNPHYHEPQRPAPEAPVLPIITTIENDLTAAGHTIDQAVHDVLSRHLTIGNMLAHAGQYAAGLENSPIVQAVERFALGPAGEAAAARIIEDVAGLLQAQGTPADSTPDPVTTQPEPTPAQ